MELLMVSVDELSLDPDNPRNNAGAVERVAESIRQFGFRVPLVVNADRMILAGHTRYMAAVMLGMKELPCVMADDLTPEQQRQFNIADNRVADFSFFDVGKLAEFELSDEFLADFDIDALLADVVDGDEFAAPKAVPEKREGLDLAPFERYQYVTVICRSSYDYSNLCERLGLDQRQSRFVGGRLKRGSSIGRIIEYADLVKLLDDGR